MASETRAGKYGRLLAVWIEYTISTLPNSSYRTAFLEELKKYSYKPRKKGEPRNEGCISELDRVSELKIQNPVHLAKLVKEGLHLMYHKKTSANTHSSLCQKFS